MQKVFVGLSGGVDSAVSAALLKNARLPDGSRRYDVTGVFIKIWRPEFTECTWKEDRIDAMRVCAALEIPFREIDLSDEYKKDIIDTMVRDYARGITPNPDVLCNRTIKFGGFASWAFQNGADLIATGHYARVRHEGGTYRLFRGADRQKDQSYFLHLMTAQDLSRTLLPIGEYQKSEVRQMAKRFQLPVSEKPDSQGLCFVGDISMSDFLSKFLQLKEGRVVDQNGTVIGSHRGAPLYTIGQRHGFTARGKGSHYITCVDTASNTIVVSEVRDHASSYGVRAAIRWIHGERYEKLVAQARYREEPFGVTARSAGDGAEILFAAPHIASPGQSLVLYRGDECLGGGPIEALLDVNSQPTAQ